MSASLSSNKKRPKKKRLTTPIAPPADSSAEPGYFFLSLLPFFLFFISGFCGLVYEVVWSRMLVPVMGNTTLATSAILAAFMTGLSLGSLFWGRFIQSRPEKPLSVFGGLEAGVGLFALVFPLLIKAVIPMEGWLSGWAGWGYHAQIIIRFLFCLILLIVPTFLMGGTLAVIGQHVIRRQPAFGRDTALLYGLNTAGAVLGTCLAGFILIKYLGHGGSIRLAAWLNLSVGAAAFLSDKYIFQSPEPEPVKRKKRSVLLLDKPSRTSVILVMTGLALSGFCALAYQVLWTRLLILVVDNSVYSFTIILMAFLTGITLGSLLLAPVFKFIKNYITAFALAEIGLAVTAFIFPFFIHLKQFDLNTPYNAFLLMKLPLVILPPAVLMGAALPLAAQVYQAWKPGVGRGLGAVFAINTIGGVCGATAAAFLLIPILGFYKSSLVLPGINLLVGGVILVVTLKGFRAVAAAAVLIFIAVMGGRVMPPGYYSFKYGELEPGHKLIYYHEGLAATATIFQRPEGTRVLYLNGIPEVDTSPVSIRTFKLMGALPGLLREKTNRTLIVTFGAGITAGTAAHFADRIDSVDLVEQAGEIAPFFAPANNNIAKNKKFYMYVDDARHFLQTTNNKYSVIICDATHPRSYDSWVLFTAEFYRQAQNRLEADGIFCQWVPFHGLDLDQYMAIIKTFSHVFPHTTIWTVNRSYSLLMALSEPFSLDFTAFQKRLSQREVRRDLMRVGLDNPFEFLAHFALGEKQVRKMTAAYPQVITDDSPAHLFFPPEATLEEQYRKWPEINFKKLISRRESVLPYLTGLGRSERDKAGIMDMIRLYERKRRW